MIGAEHPELGLEIVLVEGLRLLKAPARTEHVGQVHLVGHRVFVIAAEEPAGEVVRLSKQRFGLVEPSLAPVQIGQLIHGPDGLLIVGAEGTAP